MINEYQEIQLKNYGLSDKKDNPKKFTLPAVKIAAKGYLIVYFNLFCVSICLEEFFFEV